MWPIRLFLLFVEAYHVSTHILVFFGVRALPRKDLVRARWYFLVDTFCMLFATIYLAPHLWWLCALQMIQHFTMWSTWDSSIISKRVITWSALESKFGHIGRFDMKLSDCIFGTLFDIACHLTMVVYAASACSTVEILISLSFCAVLVRVLLFGSRFAWSTPGREPEWVKKRLCDYAKYMY